MLKVVKFHTNEQLINQSLKQNRKAQKQLYDKFAPKMLGLCRYYIRDRHQAEEVMLQGFFKVFTKLNTFSKKGSFEGWIRRIMVFESISFLRKKNNLVFSENMETYEEVSENEVELKIAIEDIENGIDLLPDGSKVVFNMYVIEGYKHAEIADLLKISVNTSKVQLSRARKALQKMFLEQKSKQHGAG